MKKDAHTKRQKQIRMSDSVRDRFEAAQNASGLTGEAFIERLLDMNEGKGETTKADVIAWIERNA